jgi:hypothetical protein
MYRQGTSTRMIEVANTTENLDKESLDTHGLTD